MYNTMREVVEAVKEKYKDAERLSRGAVTCLYGHSLNGIGCAIGCLFPADVAEAFDSANIPVFSLRDHYKFGLIFHAVISPEIDPTELDILQLVHDRAIDLPQFKARLDAYLETGSFVLKA